jgi:hypothetical protein
MKAIPFRPLLLSVSAALLLGVSPLRAQDQFVPSPGDRIRVHRIGSPALTVSLVLITPDSIRYAVDREQPEVQTIASQEVARLEVSRGRRPAGQAFLRGAGLGLVLGGPLGGLLAGATYEPCQPRDVFSCIGDFGEGAQILGGVILGGLAGGAIGGLIGAAIPGERWEPVSLPVQVAVSPAGAGTFTIALRIPR